MGVFTDTFSGETGNISANTPYGFGFVRSAMSTTWQFYYRGAGLSAASLNTGITISGRQRFRIVYLGKNCSDTVGTSRVLAFINGTLVAGGNIPLTLTNARGLANPSVQVAFRHYDQNNVSWQNVQTVDFRANTWAGDVTY